MINFIFVVPTGRYHKTAITPLFPYHLLRIASYLKKCFPTLNVQILDSLMTFGYPINLEGENKLLQQFSQYISKYDPKETIIGITTTSTSDAVHGLMFASIAKEYKFPVIFGGFGSNVAREWILKKYSHLVDAIVLGEGELPCEKLVEALEVSNTIPWHKIPNLALWREDRIFYTKKEKFSQIKHLCQFNTALIQDIKAYGRLSYSLSKGCPFKCQYCQESIVNPQYTKLPLDFVVSDILTFEDIFDEGEKILLFFDPIFCLDKKYTKDLLVELNKLEWIYSMETRADILYEDFYTYQNGHCFCILFGFESASPRMLLSMEKTRNPHKYIADMERHCRYCFDNGIGVLMSLLPHYPGTRIKDLEDTLRFCEEIAKIRAQSNSKSPLGFSWTDFSLHVGSYQYTLINNYLKEGVTFSQSYQNIHNFSMDGLECKVVNTAEGVTPQMRAQYLNKIAQIMHTTVPPDSWKKFCRYGLDPDMNMMISTGVPEKFYLDKERSLFNARLLRLLLNKGMI